MSLFLILFTFRYCWRTLGFRQRTRCHYNASRDLLQRACEEATPTTPSILVRFKPFSSIIDLLLFSLRCIHISVCLTDLQCIDSDLIHFSLLPRRHGGTYSRGNQEEIRGWGGDRLWEGWFFNVVLHCCKTLVRLWLLFKVSMVISITDLFRVPPGCKAGMDFTDQGLSGYLVDLFLLVRSKFFLFTPLLFVSSRC